MATYYLTCGEFIVESKALPHNKGIHMRIEFIDFLPDPDGVVALIQATKCTKTDQGKAPEDYPSGGSGERVEEIWTAAHWAIDAPGKKRRCPAFGIEYPPEVSPDTAWNRWRGARGKGYSGSDGRLGRVISSNNAFSFEPAMLDDRPSRTGREIGTAFHHQFESVALCIIRVPSGGVTGKVRGSIRWGYKVDATDPGVLTIDTPVVTPRPSQEWQDAASKWNFAKARSCSVPGTPVVWSS